MNNIQSTQILKSNNNPFKAIKYIDKEILIINVKNNNWYKYCDIVDIMDCANRQENILKCVVEENQKKLIINMKI